MQENIFILPDKRQLGYAVYGPVNGQPVLYFHGTPSSRLEPMLLLGYNKDIDVLTNRYNLRLIAIDRPGMGLSTYDPNGSFASCAADAVALLDHLNIDTFKILCWSGGGSFTLSTSYHYPNRVLSAHIICGFTRSFADPGVFANMGGNKYYFGAARFTPRIMQFIMNYVGKKTPDRPLPHWLSQLKPVDLNLMKDLRAFRQLSKVTLNEACRVNSKGLVHEARLYYGDTGYSLGKIQPPVHYWWGTDDNVVTKVHATSVEQQVPNNTMHYRQGEAHLSLYVNYIEEILKVLAEA
ncbi:alpha/beta hydrolase [Aridibaculum aurantiacum]|uniref:alpha/beta hydrolase n=1 Tax=Aridibaculum aurantiacum TaxID=2810307 RepID=UPI001A966AC6|nr:alpha/beta hydrolase [Aridibaculum aurantiacum]